MTLVFQLLIFVVHELHHDLVNDIFDLIMYSTSWTRATISSDQVLRVGTRSKFENRSDGQINQILIREAFKNVLADFVRYDFDLILILEYFIGR